MATLAVVDIRSTVMGSAGMKGSWKWRTSKFSSSRIWLTRRERLKLRLMRATESLTGTETTPPIR